MAKYLQMEMLIAKLRSRVQPILTEADIMMFPYFEIDVEKIKTMTESKWIPVSERLPEDNLPRFSNVKQIKVLTALISDKGVRTVRSQMRYKDTWATGYQTIWKWKYSGSEITHWMPLPEPPKEDDNGKE